MKHRFWALWITLPLVFGLAGACIKRQPPAADAQAVTAATATSAASTKPERPRAPEQPTGNYGKVPGVDVLGGRGLQAFQGHGKVERVKLTEIPVQGQPFTTARRAEILQPSANVWDVQIQAKSAAPVEEGDVLLATFYFRTERSLDESGEGATEFVFELGRDPWTKSVTYPLRGAREWKKVFVPFVAGQSYKPGEGQAIFRLGYPKQTIEIGGVTVENFGKQLALADLPRTEISYAGTDPQDPWRAAAQARIEEHRKAELKVLVRAAGGRPVTQATVRARQVRQGFLFGTAVPASLVVDPAQQKFREVLTELFNLATLENDLKWVALAGDWGPGYTIDRAEKAIQTLREAGIAVRGHVLVWPGWRNLPKSLRQYEKNPTRLRQEVTQRIQRTAGATKGKLLHWDVVNEPFDNHDLLDLLGQEAMVDWFKQARAADPAARLYINDYAILSGGGGPTPHRDHYEQTIRMLLEKGAPLDGIGMQGHFGTTLTAPKDLLHLLDRFAKLNKPILVTEYDLGVDDERLAARYTEDFYTALFSHPAVEGVVMWGFWDGSHWKNNAPLYRRDWSLKPAGEAVRDLILKRWRTDATGQTDAAGSYVVRGFLGEYEVEAILGEKKGVVRGTLAKGGSTLTVQL